MNIEQVKQGDFSFAVSIRDDIPFYDPEETHFCTGSLISRKHILTSEHCGKERVLEAKVVVGSVDIRSGTSYDVGSWLSFDDWVVNKNYLNAVKYDVAIVTVS